MAKLIALLIAISLMASFAAHAQPFLLSTNSFSDNKMMPILYTCDSSDISPQLEWENMPQRAKSLVLILADPDAPHGTFYHWVVYNIPVTLNSFPKAMLQVPPGIVVGKNSWGKTQYNGPCPPKNETHRYIFTLYALDTMLNLPSNADAPAVLHAIENHIITQTSLTAVFSH